jgi:hypothetical protein
MDFIDSEYISKISSRLEKFKKIKTDTYTFRCPFCGDSSTNKNKTRGYFYRIGVNLNYKCHNCGESLSFSTFLKKFDSELHRYYSLDKFAKKQSNSTKELATTKVKFEAPIFKEKLDLPKASENPRAKKYLEDRNINPNNFYYAAKFREWTNTKKFTFNNINYDEDRIVIPLYSPDKKLFGFIGRSISSNDVKYITIILNDSFSKIYGLDKVNSSKKVYVLEGAFDSEFIPNSIAMCGADANIDNLSFNDVVFVFDNEPRNREICSRMEKIINQEKQIVIWPSYLKEKDINLMVLAGHDPVEIINSNVYSGLQAKVKFIEWKKV